MEALKLKTNGDFETASVTISPFTQPDSMSGLLMLGSHKRTRRELADITRMFSQLLMHSERRGHHATGAAIITGTVKMLIEKAPEPAHRFVSMNAYHHLCAQISQQTTSSAPSWRNSLRDNPRI